MSQVGPALSVILATPDTFETVQETVRHLRAQSVVDQIELVLVAPSKEALQLHEADVAGFNRHQVVEIGRVTSIGSSNAKGIRAAGAPIVALAEDHAYPVPGWAEALIDAHHRYAAVGSVIRHPNDPRSAVAWADTLIAFGEYMLPIESGVVDRLPGNNSSYKRDLLLAYGDRLETMMETETLIQADLKAQGHQLYLDARAQLSHWAFETLTSYMAIKYLSGRVFGAARARECSVFRRAAYACATPLIPLVRYRRLRPRWKACSTVVTLPSGTMAMAWLGLAISAVGELTGCCFGPGEAVARRERLEFHRTVHLVPRR